MIPLFKVAMSPEIKDNLVNVLYSGYVGEGSISEAFEKKLKEHYGNDNLLLTNSGTSAIHLALDVIRETHSLVPSETEVLCTCLSCLATAMPIEALGFKIKWVDINMANLNIDLDDLERKLTQSTRIVVLVHWGGAPVDMTRIAVIKKKYKDMFGKELLVVEDSAHCFESKWGGTILGNTWRNQNYCCFSTQAIKLLTTVDGGYLITPDRESYKQAKLKRWFGLDRDAGASMRCTQSVIFNGFKMQPNDVLSTIGFYNYDEARKNVCIHKDNAEYYNNEFEKLYREGIYLPSDIRPAVNPAEAESSWWLYTIFVDRKEDFKKMMLSHGISTSEVHTRMDTHPVFKKYRAFLPNMDFVQDKYLAIPVGWWVTPEDRQYIMNNIKKGW